MSQDLNIHLARWKRWSREFLPPDPLGGLQSGYARQYSVNQAFTVFLGGHLVGGMRFTIPEARRILQDLQQWLEDAHVYLHADTCNPAVTHLIRRCTSCLIFIARAVEEKPGGPEFLYTIRCILTTRCAGADPLPVTEERFVDIFIPPNTAGRLLTEGFAFNVLNIKAVLSRFVTDLKLEKDPYPLLRS